MRIVDILRRKEKKETEPKCDCELCVGLNSCRQTHVGF